jgi:hypothetical protein
VSDFLATLFMVSVLTFAALRWAYHRGWFDRWTDPPKTNSRAYSADVFGGRTEAEWWRTQAAFQERQRAYEARTGISTSSYGSNTRFQS